MSATFTEQGRKNLLDLAEQARAGDVDSFLTLCELTGSVHAREEGIAAFDSGDFYGVMCATEHALDIAGV